MIESSVIVKTVCIIWTGVAANLKYVSFDKVNCSINYIPAIDALTSARESQTPRG